MAELAADCYTDIARRLRELAGERFPAAATPVVTAAPSKSAATTQADEEDEAWAAYLMSGAY